MSDEVRDAGLASLQGDPEGALGFKEQGSSERVEVAYHQRNLTKP
jgi:hypothetical protein